MMTIEKVERLLNSTILEDIIIGVQLAYELNNEDFISLMKERCINLPRNTPDLYYRFQRNGIIYGFGNSWLLPHMDIQPHHIDITPEKYK